MRLAAISDIHGNLGALDAVLSDIARRSIGAVINLGDILSGPLYPAETADRLMALDILTIRGNHERQLLELDPAAMGPSDRYAFDRLSVRHMSWLSGLPKTLRPFTGVYRCHGTPASDLAYLLETVEPSGARAASQEEIAQRLDGIAASLILCGHSHTPRIVHLADGRLAVNPGSVGLPAYDWDVPYPHVMECGSPHARYAVIVRTKSDWQAEIISIAYDWQSASNLAAANARSDWATALKTGKL